MAQYLIELHYMHIIYYVSKILQPRSDSIHLTFLFYRNLIYFIFVFLFFLPRNDFAYQHDIEHCFRIMYEITQGI